MCVRLLLCEQKRLKMKNFSMMKRIFIFSLPFSAFFVPKAAVQHIYHKFHSLPSQHKSVKIKKKEENVEVEGRKNSFLYYSQQLFLFNYAYDHA